MAEEKAKFSKEELDGRVELNITAPFTDGQTNTYYGVGAYPVSKENALRFIAEGRGNMPGKEAKAPEAQPTLEELAARMMNAATGNAAPKGGEVSLTDGVEDQSKPEGGNPFTGKQGSTDASQNGEGSDDESDLPNNFPGRKELVAAGFDTKEKLKTVKQNEIAKVFGDDTAKINKVGVAISKFE